MTDWPFFFTWTAQKHARPQELTGGRGARFTTRDGAEWLDFGSFSYNVNLGHGHPRMVAAIKAQADRLCLASPASVFPEKTALAKRLLEIAPDGFTKVFFTLGGAESVENALKIAKLFTGRHKLVARQRSYHGASMGALSVTGDYRRAPLLPLLPDVTHMADCYCDHCPFDLTLATCARECATQFRGALDDVAAVILEPVPGANGVLIPPPEYWPTVREACDDAGALLIADEVLTGFGRTGKWLALEHFGATPDLITIAKGLTSGYAPLGAVLVHERVAKHFEESTLYAGLTGYAHPLGVAAALEALQIYEDENLIENAAALGPALVPDGGRGIGLLAAVELDRTPDQWQRLGNELRARHLAVHLRPSDGWVVLAPPLCITEDEISAGLAILQEALNA